MTKVLNSERIVIDLEESEFIVDVLDFYMGELPGVFADDFNSAKLLKEKIESCIKEIKRPFKLGDVVELTEYAPPGFHQKEDVNMVIVYDTGYLIVACSNGVLFYPASYEIKLKENPND